MSAEAIPLIRHQNSKFINCLLPKGKGGELIRKLKIEKGIVSCSLGHARGSGVGSPGSLFQGHNVEKDVLSVIVSAKEADEIFDYIYEEAEINQPHGGFIYMGDLSKSVPFVIPPDLPSFDD